MSPSNQLLILSSSALLALAIVLGAFWLGPAWDALSRRYVADLTPYLRSLNIDDSRLAFWLRWWGLALVGGFFLMWFVLGVFVLAAGTAVLVFLAPRYLVRRQIGLRRKTYRDQLVSACVALSNAARAGMSLAQGLETVSKETPEPLATELRRIVQEYQRGRPLPEAIRDAQQRLNLDGFTLFASAILTCLERGGKVTEALERISRSLQENQRLERKLEADTASGRKVVLILGAFPAFFLGMFYLLDPEGTGLIFQTVLGQLVLLAVGLLIYVAVLWARYILKIDPLHG